MVLNYGSLAVETKEMYVHFWLELSSNEVILVFMLFLRLMSNLMHSFSMYLFHASTCFKQQVFIIMRTNLCRYSSRYLCQVLLW